MHLCANIIYVYQISGFLLSVLPCVVPSDVGDTQRADIDALFSFMLSRTPGNKKTMQ